MRTVTSLCLAGAAGITLSFALLGLVVATPSKAVPVVAAVLSIFLAYGAMSMAGKAGTPRWLPGAVLVLVTAGCFSLLWSSWE